MAGLYDLLCDRFRHVCAGVEPPDSALGVIGALCRDKDTTHVRLEDFCAIWAQVLNETAVVISESEEGQA